MEILHGRRCRSRIYSLVVDVLSITQGSCIFKSAGLVALTRLDRDYRWGKLSADDLCYSFEASFRSTKQSKVTVQVKKGRKQKLDEIVIIT